MDFERPDSVRAALEGAERLYLVTPGGSAQLDQTRVVAAAAKEVALERIVKLGSLNPNCGPSIQVEHWCDETEQMVRDTGCGCTFLRPTWFNQNFTEYVMRPLFGRVLAPVGEGRAAWVDCRDVADVAAATLIEAGHEGKVYTPTGPAVHTMPELMEMLTRRRSGNVPLGIRRISAGWTGLEPAASGVTGASARGTQRKTAELCSMRSLWPRMPFRPVPLAAPIAWQTGLPNLGHS